MTEPAPDIPSAVLDTNAVLDWLVFRDPGVGPLVAALEAGAVRWLATARTQAELFDVIGRAHLDRWKPDRERLLSTFSRLALLCPPPPPSRLTCSDADDQVFIDLALARRSRWLVTHDRALLRLAGRARPFGVQIVPPARWSMT